MNPHETTSILKHFSQELYGHVQCEQCKKTVEIKPPAHYAVYLIWNKTLVSRMIGFACEECFLKEHPQLVANEVNGGKKYDKDAMV
jgi:hypothetical protein